jgi:hypothetical protein
MKLGEENRRRRLLGTSKTPPPSAYAVPSADDSDSEGSIVRTPSKAHASCGACRTRDTNLWWKAPKGLPTPVLCDACGISWRKYADLNHLRPIREEAAAAKQGKAEKREGTPLAGSNSKRVKVSVLCSISARMGIKHGGSAAQTNGSFSSTPPSTASNGSPQHRCLACHKFGSGKVFKCKECQTRVHSGKFHLSQLFIRFDAYSSCLGACGIVDPGSVESWTCDLCQNEKTAEASLVRHYLVTLLLALPITFPEPGLRALCSTQARARQKGITPTCRFVLACLQAD